MVAETKEDESMMTDDGESDTESVESDDDGDDFEEIEENK